MASSPSLHLAAHPPVGSAPAIDAATRLLVMAPHPDDESLGCGLLIQQVRAAGGQVKVLLFTHGDNNPWPQRWLERRLWIGAAARRRWGERRRGEVAAALASLQLPLRALQSLGWPDMGLTDRLLHQPAASLDALTAAIADWQPTLVALPSLDDRHPDHGSCHVLAALALARLGYQGATLAYLVHGKPTAPRQGWTVSSDPAQLARKLAALDQHRSQMALSGKRLRRFAQAPEQYHYLPPTDGQPPTWTAAAWMRPWLRVVLAQTDGVHSWPWSQAPLQADPAGGMRLDLRQVAAPAGAGPRFARLQLELPSPWIFDHWGWSAF